MTPKKIILTPFLSSVSAEMDKLADVEEPVLEVVRQTLAYLQSVT